MYLVTPNKVLYRYTFINCSKDYIIEKYTLFLYRLSGNKYIHYVILIVETQ